MIRDEYIFKETLNDIAESIAKPEQYKVLRASALLRQLLLDDLTDRVNRNHKHPISFRLMDAWNSNYNQHIITKIKPKFLLLLDGIDPGIGLTNAPIVELNRDEFLAYKVGLVGGQEITVKDIIKQCANVEGGVHYGNPGRGEGLKALADADHIQVLGGVCLCLEGDEDVDLRGVVVTDAAMAALQGYLVVG